MGHVRRKQILAGLLAACMVMLAGCGEAEREDPPASPEVFRSKEIACYYQTRRIDDPIHAQGFGGWIMGSNMTENGLYYLFQPTFGPDKRLRLYQLSVAQLYHEDVLSGNYAAVRPVGLTRELPLPEPLTELKIEWIAVEHCQRFFQGENGELYYLTFNTDDESRWLYHVDAEGRELSRTDVTEVLRDMPAVPELSEGYLENSSCAIDSQGRVYLTDQGREQLWILDSQGNLHMRLSLPEETQQLTAWQDGQIYLVTGEDAASQIKRLDGESGRIETVTDMAQTVGGGALVSGAGDGNGADGGRLLYRDRKGLYACDLEQNSVECLVEWKEADISGGNILQAREITPGKIYIWEDDYTLTQMSFVNVADIPAEKQKVTVAVTGFHDTLDMAVAEFNRHNAYYEAEIVEYDYFEGPQKLETELATGKAPDLLDTQLLYMDKLVEKDLLADISPYLEDGKGIEREDLVEAVLRCNTTQGVLTCIPESFALEVLVGKPGLLGDEPGWTLEEYMSCIQENAGLEVMGSNRFSYSSNQSGYAIVNLPMDGDSAHWADYRQGEARFDQEDFRALLEMACNYKVTRPAVDLTAAEELQEGRMLTYVAALYSMEDYLLLNAVLQRETVYKGYPTADGSPVYSLVGRNGYAINAHSQVQDGAWALIEFLMTYPFSDEQSGTFSAAEWFSTIESQFDYQMRQSMVKEYQTDQNYNLIYDEAGQPIEAMKYQRRNMSGGVTAESPAASAEDVDSLRSLIDAASRPSNTASDIPYQIVYEEIGACLEGQRSVQETVEIIQSRVQLFLDENR